MSEPVYGFAVNPVEDLADADVGKLAFHLLRVRNLLTRSQQVRQAETGEEVQRRSELGDDARIAHRVVTQSLRALLPQIEDSEQQSDPAYVSQVLSTCAELYTRFIIPATDSAKGEDGE